MARFNLVTYCAKVRTVAKAIVFLQSVGVLPKTVQCSKCDKTLSILERKPCSNYFYFPCKECHTKKSIRDNTILSNKHLGMRTLCLLVYMFTTCNGLTLAQKLREVHYNITLTLYLIS